MTVFELFAGKTFWALHNYATFEDIRAAMVSPPADLQRVIHQGINTVFSGEVNHNKVVRVFLCETLVVDPRLRPSSVRALLNNKLFSGCSSVSGSDIFRKLEDLSHGMEDAFAK